MEWVAVVVLVVVLAFPLWALILGRYCRPFKLWMAGYSKYSTCWLGQHRWDMPGGHCERCGMCDEFFERHDRCRVAKQHQND